jgi:hypothetical protein
MAEQLLFLKKITCKEMGLKTRQQEEVAEVNKPKAVSVLRVWGIVNKRTSGVSTINAQPYTTYGGEFAAINLLDGNEARSQNLILPAIAETVINKMFEGASKDGGGSAQIALEITVTYNPPKTENSNFTKFQYGVRPLMEFKGEDAMSAMAKALPAPTLVGKLKK